ncbi:hypothetical protein [Rhizobium sp.]|uniref:hypothetical protein n=1 Tax=Rhizobium sp. TaxID=391 RepID=UPI003981CBCD|nr:hypothetical protein [Rhizobium sp. MC62]
MKSDFGESMIWLAGIGGGGDGSPQRVRPHVAKAARRGDAFKRADGSKFREPGKNQTLSCFSPVFFVLSNRQL